MSPCRLLSDNLDRNRNKYQAKLRQLERQILQPMMKKQFGKSFVEVGGRFVNENEPVETGESIVETSSVCSSDTERSSDI